MTTETFNEIKTDYVDEDNLLHIDGLNPLKVQEPPQDILYLID